MTTQNDPTLRVEARFKNARLYNAIAEQSVSLSTDQRLQTLHAIGPIKSWCDLNGLSYGTVYLLLNLKLSPMGRYWCDGVFRLTIRPICTRIAALLERPVEWLFPADLYSITWPTLATDVDHTRLVPLLGVRPAVFALPPTQHDALEHQEFRRTLSGVLQTLTPREEQIVRLRFGFDGPEQTQEDVGKVFQVTRERVRQIEAKAMRKLRHHSRSKRLKMMSPFPLAPRRWEEEDED